MAHFEALLLCFVQTRTPKLLTPTEAPQRPHIQPALLHAASHPLPSASPCCSLAFAPFVASSPYAIAFTHPSSNVAPWSGPQPSRLAPSPSLHRTGPILLDPAAMAILAAASQLLRAAMRGI